MNSQVNELNIDRRGTEPLLIYESGATAYGRFYSFCHKQHVSNKKVPLMRYKPVRDILCVLMYCVPIPRKYDKASVWQFERDFVAYNVYVCRDLFEEVLMQLT